MDGISSMIIRTVDKSEVDIRKDLYKTILLSGGTTMFPGFPTRLKTDIMNLFKKQIEEKTRDKNQKYKVNVLDKPNRKNAVFIGASICANVLSGNPGFWVTKEQFEDRTMRELIHQDGLG
eukprot:TRINITY_DN8059_c0_g2_i20.p3 TRINITY_DN8059_c0_g2~~TRINITY_DN8059_c0_g2_i20.p3  ORF type:complete len:120 (+),score=37.88 TRINITY_DN8059_c0_g2_i20:1061-1420(+)